MTLRYVTRPISDRTWIRPAAQRKRSQFDSDWSQTLDLLEREIDFLKGRDVVIEVDIREQDIRLDGGIRANAVAETPAVVVAFESKHLGPMLYRADRYSASWKGRPGWQENVRAVALTLEALRTIDRYGATETGQQYTGFKALPAGRAMPASHMTRDDAIALIADCAEIHIDHDNATTDSLRNTWRLARRNAHPDRLDGNRLLWDQLEQAGQVLDLE